VTTNLDWIPLLDPIIDLDGTQCQMRNTGKSHRVSEFKLRLDGLKLALVIRAHQTLIGLIARKVD